MRERNGDGVGGEKRIDDLIVVTVVVETGSPCRVGWNGERQRNSRNEQPDDESTDRQDE